MVAVHGCMPEDPPKEAIGGAGAGAAVPNPLFFVPPNTAVLQTGTGSKTGTAVSTSFDITIKKYFENNEALIWTFANLLGLNADDPDPILETISYSAGRVTAYDNLPDCMPDKYSEKALNKQISVSEDEVSSSIVGLSGAGELPPEGSYIHKTGKPLWGVYRVDYPVGGSRRVFIPGITQSIIDRQIKTQEALVYAINANYVGINIIFFLNCNPAFECKGIGNYSIALEFSQKNTHFQYGGEKKHRFKKPGDIPNKKRAQEILDETHTYVKNSIEESAMNEDVETLIGHYFSVSGLYEEMKTKKDEIDSLLKSIETKINEIKDPKDKSYFTKLFQEFRLEKIEPILNKCKNLYDSFIKNNECIDYMIKLYYYYVFGPEKEPHPGGEIPELCKDILKKIKTKDDLQKLIERYKIETIAIVEDIEKELDKAHKIADDAQKGFFRSFLHELGWKGGKRRTKKQTRRRRKSRRKN
jgi:hypothetical protein